MQSATIERLSFFKSFINNGANVNYMYSNGYMHYIAVNGSVGVRPSISLKPSFKLTGSGTGTTSAPYIIE